MVMGKFEVVRKDVYRRVSTSRVFTCVQHNYAYIPMTGELP